MERNMLPGEGARGLQYQVYHLIGHSHYTLQYCTIVFYGPVILATATEGLSYWTTKTVFVCVFSM